MQLYVKQTVLLLLLSSTLYAADLYWSLSGDHGIAWNVQAETRLPHEDHIEMSGRRVSGILRYKVDKRKHLSVDRQIFYPQFRRLVRSDEADWMDYRSYLVRSYDDQVLPQVVVDGQWLALPAVDSLRIDGILNAFHTYPNGLVLHRRFYPSPDKSMFIEQWTLSNASDKACNVYIAGTTSSEPVRGNYGDYRVEMNNPGIEQQLQPGESVDCQIRFSARYADQAPYPFDSDKELSARYDYMRTVRDNLVLDTPDDTLNRFFEFSKIRTLESIFDSKMGLVHSPGGGNYYAGVWANDQIEYSAPFFPYTGYSPAIEATINAGHVFAGDMGPGYHRIWPSHEIQGDLTCCDRDRGDAAMVAYGLTRFLMEQGDRELAAEFWPAIEWCLEYCERQVTVDGVIASDSDEMEGRIPTGDANLSTSVLTYGALTGAVSLGRSLGVPDDQVSLYESRAQKLAAAIESYFGADIDGLHTYQYFDGHEGFRHWICLPLVMGLQSREHDTVTALFTRLWTPLGLRVQTGVDIWWDRGTLYALNGAFQSGETERAMPRFREYYTKRLLGDHVPYAMEAWPENNQAHLAAESALVGRVVLEGLFGINPTGLHSFVCKPQLPDEWDHMELKNVHGYGTTFDLTVTRKKSKLVVKFVPEKGKAITQAIESGKSVEIEIK